MGLKDIFDKIDRLDRSFDRLVDRLFVLVAFVFGAWVFWSILSATELSLAMKVLGAFIGAVLSALAMWIFWFFAKLFM